MSEEFDTIIVGSGIAATLVADRLLESNPRASILILEAGTRIPSRDRRNWWELVLRGKAPYESTYDRERSEGDPPGHDPESYSIGNTKWAFKESRVRAYGGSTMHWGGWALRYKEEDFNCRTRTGFGADWPFDYDELEPWYTLAEQLIGVGGDGSDEGPRRSGDYPLPPFPFSANESELAEAMLKMDPPLKPGHMPIARFKRCMTTGTCKYCPIGSRYSAQDHMDALLYNPKHENLRVLTSSPVQRILVDNNRAEGVECLNTVTGVSSKFYGQRVIVCAGAYESTKLLLASTSPEWPSGIGNRYDQVGRHIVTHLMLRVIAPKKDNPKAWFQEYDFPTLMSRSWDTPEQQPSGKFLIFNNRRLPEVRFESLMIDGKSTDEIRKAAAGPRTGGLDAFIEEFSEPDNRLTLAPGTGQFGLPKMRVAFSRRSTSKFDQLVKTAEGKLLDILKLAGYETGESKTRDPRGDHASGVCRMGLSPDASVTTGDLTVHGFQNLFVCSNAVLPNAAAVNPTLTLAALSLRLGSRVAVGEI